MVNLLPKTIQNADLRRYYLRATALVAYMSAIVIALGAILLAPSYFLARAAADASNRYLAALEETVGLRERAGVSKQVAALSERIHIMKDYASAGRTPLMTSLTDSIPRGVSITTINITRTDTGATVSVAGSADTREALLSFAAALKNVSTFSGVALPVSALAGDAHIPFSLDFVYTAP